MARKRTLATGITAAIGMLALILDPKTALYGASAGVELCVKTVIPSLFPFFILSIILTGTVTGTRIRCIRPIGKICGIPAGAESILLAGFLGGYPVGAQCVCQAYSAGQLDRANARRMLGFCSNAGPAFIFGMVAVLFKSKTAPFILWGIHILSALLVGFLLPGRPACQSATIAKRQTSLGQAMQQSTRIMANVCGWVVLFRVILTFLARWFLWLLPQIWQIGIGGVLELTNGCLDLNAIDSEGIRLILSSVFLGFGGICVGMQTVSITAQAGLDSGLYFPGKILQAIFSALLSIPAASLLFPEASIDPRFVLGPLIIGVVILLRLKNGKNNSSIPVPSGV